LIQYTPIVFTFIFALLLPSIYFITNDPLSSPLFALWVSSLAAYAYIYIKTGKQMGLGYKDSFMSLGKVSAYTVAISPFILVSIINAFKKNRTYKVTPKGGSKIKGKEIYVVLIFGIVFLIEMILYLIKGAILTTFWLFYYSLAYLYTFYYTTFKEL
ncbi:MAG: glycosyltransferase family 2 protein, partial [Sulfolobaceae archaeon]